MKNVFFIANTLKILLWNFLKYKTNLSSKLQTIKEITNQLSKSNIIYIKILQSLATNGALFDNEQMQYLEQFTDNVPYTNEDIDLSFIDTINVISRQNNEEFILDENPKPFRSGSIALVYKGTLNNKPVVIKVIRNNIQEKIIQALDEMDDFFRFLSWIPDIKALNIIAILRENREALINQTNFIKELNNLNEMKQLCKYTDYIEIPTVYPNYTKSNSNIIVMDFLEGKRIEEITTTEAAKYSKLMAQFEVKTTLFNTFYHADLHSGNIVFINKNDTYKLGIFDFGIMGRATKQEQEALYNMLKSMDNNTNDGYDSVITVLDNIVEPKETVQSLSPSKRKTIINKMKPYVSDIINGKKGITPYHLYKINKCLVEYNFFLANSFCKMHMAMLAMDSVSHRLNGRSTHLHEIKNQASLIFNNEDTLLEI